MFEKLRNLVKGQPSFDLSLSKNYTKKELDLIALLLKDNPDRQREFENLYEQFEVNTESLNLFQQNAAKVIDKSDKLVSLSAETEILVEQIVEELVSQTVVWDSSQNKVLPLPQPVRYLQSATVQAVQEDVSSLDLKSTYVSLMSRLAELDTEDNDKVTVQLTLVTK